MYEVQFTTRARVSLFSARYYKMNWQWNLRFHNNVLRTLPKMFRLSQLGQGYGQKAFLLSNVGPGNATVLRGHVACELRVERGCFTIPSSRPHTKPEF
jgi:hypothetical protein